MSIKLLRLELYANSSIGKNNFEKPLVTQRGICAIYVITFVLSLTRGKQIFR